MKKKKKLARSCAGRMIRMPLEDTTRDNRAKPVRSPMGNLTEGVTHLGMKLDWSHYAHCHRYGHWKNECP